MDKERYTIDERIKLKQQRENKIGMEKSAGFNLINQNYERNIAGSKLKDRELVIKTSQLNRAKNIFEKNNQRFDIVTGQAR